MLPTIEYERASLFSLPLAQQVHIILTGKLKRLQTDVQDIYQHSVPLFPRSPFKTDKFVAMRIIKTPNSLPPPLVLSPNSQTMATTSAGVVQVWNLNTGKSIVSFRPHAHTVSSILLTESYICTISSKGNMRLSALPTGQQKWLGLHPEANQLRN